MSIAVMVHCFRNEMDFYIYVAVELVMKTVYNEVCSITPQYFTFGLNLGLQYHKLKEIESNFGDAARRLQEVIAQWLATTTHSEWAIIADSLIEMKEEVLAQSIISKYCPLTGMYIITPIDPLGLIDDHVTYNQSCT